MWKLYIVNILLIGFLQLGIISNSAYKWLIMLIHKKKLHPSKLYITKAEDDQQCNRKRTDDLTTL